MFKIGDVLNIVDEDGVRHSFVVDQEEGPIEIEEDSSVQVITGRWDDKNRGIALVAESGDVDFMRPGLLFSVSEYTVEKAK